MPNDTAPRCNNIVVLKSKLLLDSINVVKLLPSEELYLDGLLMTEAVGEGLSDYLAWTTEVTVCSGLGVDRVAELEALLDGAWSHIEHLADLSRNLSIGEVDLGCAIGIDEEAHWLCYTDGVSYLYECLVCNTCCDEVISDVTSSVGS